MWSDLVHRVRAVFRRKTVEREMDDELRFHVERQVEKYTRAGLSTDDAARRARLEFGQLDDMKEKYRDALGISILERIAQDLRYAVRTMLGNPGFTAVTVLSLALAIGANTAIFSIVNTLILRELRVSEPDKLLEITRSTDTSVGGFSYPIYERIRDQNMVFGGVLAMSAGTIEATVEHAEAAPLGRFVSGNFFDLLGLSPAVGRLLSSQDDRLDASEGVTVAVVSYGFWQRNFGGSPDVIGKTFQIGTVPFTGTIPFTVVGVLPRTFTGLIVGRPDDFFIPMASERRLRRFSLLNSAGSNWLKIVGRLKPGSSPESTITNLDVIWGRFLADSVSRISADEQRRLREKRLSAVSARAGLSEPRRQFSGPVLLLMGAVTFVLLIACMNLVNLLLARGMARRHEIAVRLAIGASRARLIQQILTESVVLGVAGGVGGLGIAVWGMCVIATLMSAGDPTMSFDIALDGRVLLFTAIISLGSALLVAMIPAVRLSASVAPTMQANARTLSGTRTVARWNKVLIAGQVALSLVLLTGALLVVSSLRNLRTLDAGFEPEHVVLMRLNPERVGYVGDRGLAYYHQVLERARGIPGVRAASLSLFIPVSGGGSWDLSFAVDGGQPEPDARVYVNEVSDGFFITTGTRLIAGREFTPQDGPNSPPVAVINEVVARRYFKNENPVGHHVTLAGSQVVEVVGVVANAKYVSLREEDSPTVYLDALQNRNRMGGALTLSVKVIGDPMSLVPSIVREIQGVSATVPMTRASLLSANVDRSLVRERLVTRILLAFGVLALLLASIGLYGVLAYTVTRRTNEIGLRFALGATRREVLSSILRESSKLVAMGVAFGIPAALALTRLLESLLYGLTPTDPWVLSASVLCLFLMGLAAASVPAVKASRVNPLVALRHE